MTMRRYQNKVKSLHTFLFRDLVYIHEYCCPCKYFYFHRIIHELRHNHKPHQDPTSQTNNLFLPSSTMGVLISLPLLTHEGYIKYKEKRAARKLRKEQQLQSQDPTYQATTSSPPPAYTSQRQSDLEGPQRGLGRREPYRDTEERESVEILRQGLLGEHLSTASPLASTGWQEEQRARG